MSTVHEARRSRLRALLAEELPGRSLVVTRLVNIAYLTGFSGSNGVLLVAPDPADDVLATDGRYVDQAAQEAPGLHLVIDRDSLSALLARLSGRSLAVEASVSAADLRACRRVDQAVDLAPALVEGLRAVKDPGELDALERACRITADALQALAGEIVPGCTEILVARRLEQLFGELGAQDRSFETIVASGTASALPHHRPDGRVLGVGDLLVIDCGALVDGYHADMTRTFVVGREPQDWQRDLHDAVEEAQRAAREVVRPGVDQRSLDDAARDRLVARGLGDRFTHGLGHGVGLEIHEAPMIGPRSTGSITAGMAITVEPGAYLPGRGGVRIEDTLAVTASGARVLTEAPRALVVVGA